MRAALPALLLLLAGSAAAIELLPAPEPRAVEAGRAVAAGGGNQGPGGACFQCHGFDGRAQAAAAFPAIGGMSAEYLNEQLRHYASGARKNPIMGPIAAALTEEERRNVALFYASLPTPPAAGQAEVDAALLQHGGVLSAVGSAEAGIQGCQNCHGPGGIGIGPLYPRLAGQPALYLAAQLRAWRDGTRDPGAAQGMMAGIARRMSDRDIEAAAAYFASVRLEPPARQRGVLP